MNEIDRLRSMNIGKQRTDVENLFLREMVEEDLVDLFTEDTELDALISLDTNTLFTNSSSKEFEDTIGNYDTANFINQSIF